MKWIRFNGRCLEYTGKLTRPDAYDQWTGSEGMETVERLMGERRGLFKACKKRHAKKVLWNDLRLIANTQVLRAVINEEVKSYTIIPGTICERGVGLLKSDTFPNVTVVPRYMVHAYAYDGMVSRLNESDEISRLKGGKPLKEFFFRELVRQLDNALPDLRIDTHRPVVSSGNTYIIGVEKEYRWSDILLPGLFFVAGNISGRFSSEEVKSLEGSITELMIRLGRLSHGEKEMLIGDMKV